MACSTEFKLDFTIHLLRSDLPTYKQVVASYSETIQGAPIDVLFRKQKDGVFIIKTSNEKDEKKLECSSLTYYYGKKQEKQIKVRFQKLPKFQLYTNPKWVTLDWIEDSGLRYAENTFFDEYFSKYGTIIKTTHDDKNELGMKNGKKKIRLDLDKGENIPRVNWLEAKIVLEDGTEKTTKGKIKVYYSNQPIFCKLCKIEHEGKCPEKIKRDELFKDYEINRQKENKAFIVSDSNLRHVNEMALHAKTHVSSGAKIGHLDNVIKNSDLDSVNHIIVNVGLCNIDSNPSTNFDRWYNNQKPQISALTKSLTDLSAKGKKSVVIAVPEAPLTKTSAKTKKMRDSINKSFETMCKSINNTHPNSVSVIHICEKMENGVETFTDDLHISQQQTEKLIQRVDAELQDYNLVVGNRPDGIPLSQGIIHSVAYSSYCLK